VTHFAFLKPEWPDVCEAASKAEATANPDPRTGCFYARRALELLVQWMFKHDSALKLPYQDNLSALIHEPTFKTAAGDAVFNKARTITRLGNAAVHSFRPVYAPICSGRAKTRSSSLSSISAATWSSSATTRTRLTAPPATRSRRSCLKNVWN
jgi:hypothetical protein